MSENSTNEQTPTELDVLKARAKLMNISHSNNISIEKLREKIEAKLAGEADADAEAEDAEQDEGEDAIVDAGFAAEVTLTAPVGAPVAPKAVTGRKLTKAEQEQAIRAQLHEEQMVLVRCRISCLNPAKKDLHGEIISVGNKYLGTVRKYVPFGEATDAGYHIPKILYTELKERQFQQIKTGRDPRTGTPTVSTRWVREFAIEVLPPLTKEELHDLALAQAAAGSVDRGAAIN
jgi:hypothetical protein